MEADEKKIEEDKKKREEAAQLTQISKEIAGEEKERLLREQKEAEQKLKNQI